MTEDTVIETVSTEQDPIAELKKMISEQGAVILKQNEEIKKLTARMNDAEKVSSATPVQEKPAEPQKSAQDIAWESMMKEMNIKEE